MLLSLFQVLFLYSFLVLPGVWIAFFTLFFSSSLMSHVALLLALTKPAVSSLEHYSPLPDVRSRSLRSSRLFGSSSVTTVKMTPLSFLPGTRIMKYLGIINMFFIRETTSLREVLFERHKSWVALRFTASCDFVETLVLCRKAGWAVSFIPSSLRCLLWFEPTSQLWVEMRWCPTAWRTVF